MEMSFADVFQTRFLEYVEKIVDSRKSKKLQILKRGLSNDRPQMTFPSNPMRYIHNFSSLQLSPTLIEALS